MIALASGIYRSGSTWCYNVIRLAMQSKYEDVGYGYKDRPDLDVHENWALKWHEPLWVPPLIRVIHSTRDYEQCVESAREVLDRVFTVEYLARLDAAWKSRADLLLNHDDIRDRPVESAQAILDTLWIQEDAEAIVWEIDQIKFPTTEADNVSLFHKNHRRTR